MRFDLRPKRSNIGGGYVDNPPSFIGPGSRLNLEPLCQYCYQTLHLSQLEIMSLEVEADIAADLLVLLDENELPSALSVSSLNLMNEM